MKFSIITPSYNQGRYLRDCIESVRHQPGVEWEHWVIDGGSTDETVAILKEYPHLQWISEPDQGQTDAINKGFRRATGDWVMWLNSDDYLVPGALAEVARFASQQPQADLIYGNCDFVSEDKRVVGGRREFDFDFNMLLFYGCFIPSTSTFLRHRVIAAGQLPDPSFRVLMDHEYYLRLAQAGFVFCHLPQTLACFRWHETNISTTHTARGWEERLRIQRHYLALAGRSYLGREWLLQLLFRGYQARRFVRRSLRRLRGA